jgi:tRNA (guanine37-N1)-methyltransferase
MLTINLISIFPDFFTGPLGLSIPKRAAEAGLVTYRCIDLRAFATDKHKTVDDAPFGGGPGMVMKPQPLLRRRRIGRRHGPDRPPLARAGRSSRTPTPSASPQGPS